MAWLADRNEKISYYFRIKEEADAAFKVAVKDAKKHFKGLIKSSEKALEILDKL